MPKYAAISAEICIGVSFKPLHFEAINQDRAKIDFFEVHAENYMGQGGVYHQQLQQLKKRYPLSFHAVGLSIGGTDPLDTQHLDRLKQLCEYYQPFRVSEHLAWSVLDGVFLNDLLPLVYDEISLGRIISRINQIQDYLGYPLLLENPARYLALTNHTLEETQFLEQVVKHSGCGLLLDINNIYVSAFNLGFDPYRYLAYFPLQQVEEIHLAGHSIIQLSDGEILLDDHGSAVADKVWELFHKVVEQIGPKPTLIEWDTNLPNWTVLCAEADKARSITERIKYRLDSQGEQL
jgi:uncharacterized protein (UPF0276 family)